MAKVLSFKDFVVADYTPGMGEYVSYRAQKRHRGVIGEEVEQVEEGVFKGLGKHLAKRKFTKSANRASSQAFAALDKGGKNGVGEWDKKSQEYLRYRKAFKRLNRKEEVEVDEALDVSQRRKIAIRMKRLAPRLKIAREKALRRTPDMAKIKKRASKQARNQMFKTLTKGKSRGEVSLARRKEIEKKLDKLKPRIERMARKMIPNVRKLDRERKQSKSKGDK